jgi:hypothetical protein
MRGAADARAAGAALVLLAFSAPAAAGPAVDVAAAEAAGWFRETHFGVYCGEQKVGWMRRSLARMEFRDVAAIARETEMHLDVSGDGNEIVQLSRSVFAAEGEQLVLTVRSENREQERRTWREIVRKDQRFDVLTMRRGETTEGAVGAIALSLADELVFERLAALAASRAGGPVGATLTVGSLDLGNLTSGRRTFTVAGVEGEGAARVFQVSAESGGGKETLRLAPSGTPVSGQIGARFRFVIEAADVARDASRRKSLQELARIALQGDLAEPAKVRRVVVAWDDPQPRVFSESGRQRVRREGKTLLVEVSRDADSGPADEAAVRDALADDEGLVLTDPIVGQAAISILSGTSSRAVQVRRLLEALHGEFKKETVVGTPTAPEILRRRGGDCTEHARAFVALCRVSGIPARTVRGLAWTTGEKPAFAWHQWAEVALNGRWHAVDPTFGENPAPATHLAIEPSPEAQTLLWGAKLRLVEADRSAPPEAPEGPEGAPRAPISQPPK